MATEAAPTVKPVALALVGPTASGKTAAALALARELPLEIISMDSALVYRGMDIGSAKPEATERAAVVHHLIDIRDPLQVYNAAEFAADARALITQIRARGKLPLLVGGTLLYYKALRDGLHSLPKADVVVRAALERLLREHGAGALHAELQRVDPLSAARLHPSDVQRVGRALEVFRITGEPLSSLHATKKIAASDDGVRAGAPNEPQTWGSAWPVIALEPSDRGWLHQRIEQRFDAMLAAGFMDEMHTLRARGDLHADLPAMRCVGYRQAWQALQDGAPLAQWRPGAIAATRQLAKRQLTWLRGMPERHVVPCDAPQALGQVLALARRHAT